MQCNEVWEERGEEGNREDAGTGEEEVPREVDKGGEQVQFVFLPQEASQGLVIIQQGPCHTQEGGANPKPYKHSGKEGEEEQAGNQALVQALDFPWRM